MFPSFVSFFSSAFPAYFLLREKKNPEAGEKLEVQKGQEENLCGNESRDSSTFCENLSSSSEEVQKDKNRPGVGRCTTTVQ